MFERFFGSRRNDLTASDLQHVMQGTQSIMGEIVLENLLPKLLTIFIEMSKATKGAILIVKEKKIKIAAIGTSNPTIQINLQSLNLESNHQLPISIINQVARIQKIIWLKSANKLGDFSTDPYIQENQTKTVLCLPLHDKQNKLIALIYLENNLLADAIKLKQIDILKLMSIPAGLCIENAQLYKQVENFSHTLKDTVQELKLSQKISQGQVDVITSTLDILIKEPELDKLIEIVLSAISIQLNSESSVVCLFDAKKDTISHYMTHKSNSIKTYTRNLPVYPEKTYYQVSEHPFWSRLINLTKPLSLPIKPSEITDSDLYQDLNENGIKTSLFLPLMVGNQLLGLLGIHRTESNDFSTQQIELAVALAKQTSLAIKLTNLASKNRSSAILEERNRLAREIHDTLAQTFTGISIQAGVTQRLLDKEPTEAKNLLNRIGELAREGITEAKRSVWALCPETLECKNLPEALSQLLTIMTANLDIKTEFNLQGTPIDLDSTISLNLLRIGQEALINSLKHSQSQNIWLDLIFNQNRVLLKLRDDGRGFNIQQTTNNAGFGLIGMRQRAEQLGSELMIISQLKQGTEIRVDVDLSDYLDSAE